MPFGEGAALFEQEFFPASEALAELKTNFPYLGTRGYSSTAERHVLDVDGRLVTVGFIPSVSRPFCSRCDRIRLDSRGYLYGCLRSNQGIDLGGDVRRQHFNELRAKLCRALDDRIQSESAWPKRSMALLGG